jgi:C1A family cysteine protease
MTAEFDFEKNDEPFYSGYRIELEDRQFLLATDCRATYRSFGDLPVEVDPRKSNLASIGWLQVEDQRQQGSCQGQALTECAEFCYAAASGGKVVQLSRQYAYIRSQQFDNIRSDSGSTLSGGTKCAIEGICDETIGPYRGSSYPGWGYITDAMRADAKNYRLMTHTAIKSADELKQYVGSGIGIIQIGISWNSSMTPDSKGCIRRFSSGGGGGHSVVFCGYVPDSAIGVQSSAGWWALMKNSWGTRWGVGGYAYVEPSAINQMIRASWSVFVGRSDMVIPGPRNIDWTKERILV